MNIYKDNDRYLIPLPELCNGDVGKEVLKAFNEEIASVPHSLVLDFINTKTIDSSMIGVLVSLDKATKKLGNQLILKNLGKNISDLFTDTGMDILFTIESPSGTTQASVDLFEPGTNKALEISIEHIRDVCILHLRGIMNHPIGTRLLKKKILLAMIEYKKILVDFENLTFFDSLSISVIVSLNKLLIATGGSMRFCRTNYIVSELFKTLTIDQIISTYDTVDQSFSTWF